VAVVALAALGWMLNDMRLKVDKLANKVEDVTDRVDKHLPKILTETEQVGKTVNTDLPPLVQRSEDVLARSEVAVDSLVEFPIRKDCFRLVVGASTAAAPGLPPRDQGDLLLRFCAGEAQWQQGPARTTRDGEEGQRGRST
jgi:hypothetical protein